MLQATYRREVYSFDERSDALADEAYRAAAEVGDWYAEFQRGFYLLWRGVPDRALEHFAVGRRLARDIGDAVMEVRCLVYSTVAHRKCGRVDEADACLGELDALHELYGYDGLYEANRAWLAWRGGAADEAEQHAGAALANWQQSGRTGPTVFQWTARFPLLALEVARGRADAALVHARAMLDSSQQPLPRDLGELLQSAIDAGEARFLERAVDAGRDRGYT
jgi:hypothetical protein